METNGNGNLGALAAALAKAQVAFPKVLKDRTAKIDSTKGGYSYKYSDLASLLEAVRKPLADNELAISQPIEITDKGMVLHTMLLHSSGAHLDSFYALATHDRPQEMGSEITYSRRYTAGAILGIASEDDDDGAAAQQGSPGPRRQFYQRAPVVTAPMAEIGKPERGAESVEVYRDVSEELLPSPPPPEDDRKFLENAIVRQAKAQTLSTAEKLALTTVYLKGKQTNQAATDDLNRLYVFLMDRTAVAQWREEQARKAGARP